MSPVLSCEHEILSYTSPCVCSDQWALAPAERSSTFQWPHGSWHRCQWAAHVHTVLPRTNHLPASTLFKIKLFNLTVFSSAFFQIFISCTYITHCHRSLVHYSFWTPLRLHTGLRLRYCTCTHIKSKIQNCIIADDVTAGFTSSVPLSDRKYVTLNDNSFILDTRLVY